MIDKALTQFSKMLSYVLRHRPDEIKLVSDESGYALVTELITQFNAHYPQQLSPEILAKVVAENSKKRFAFSEDGTKIRASQGHSIDIELGYTPQPPPECLYHGTALTHLNSIRATGSEKRSRHHVHLSADPAVAKAVGSQHGVPVVLTVKSGEMHRNGLAFYQSDNGVWLTDNVPIQYLDFPPQS